MNLAKHLGHIDNYLTRIESRDFDAFSNSRLKLIYKLYKDFNTYLEKSCDSLLNIEAKTNIYKVAEGVIRYNTLQSIPKESCQNVEYINSEIVRLQTELISDLNREDFKTFKYLLYILSNNIYSIFSQIEINKIKKAFTEMNKLLIDSCDENYDDLEKNPEYLKYQEDLKESLHEKLTLDI